ncbi:hypothetical protein GCM10007897_01990 [Sphingobium jiangsuense]|nr:hypothetical protein GCM10007897_01990 [Sphingobium jiangsuense]
MSAFQNPPFRNAGRTPQKQAGRVAPAGSGAVDRTNRAYRAAEGISLSGGGAAVVAATLPR